MTGKRKWDNVPSTVEHVSPVAMAALFLAGHRDRVVHGDRRPLQHGAILLDVDDDWGATDG